MQGRQPTWPDAARPCDLVEGDPVEFWRATVMRARDVLRTADLARVMETPPGRTVADDLAIPVIEVRVDGRSCSCLGLAEVVGGAGSRFAAG